jgi:hypothetical protein
LLPCQSSLIGLLSSLRLLLGSLRSGRGLLIGAAASGLCVHALLGSGLISLRGGLLLELSHLAPRAPVALGGPFGQRLNVCLPLPINRTLAYSSGLGRPVYCR